jgi:2-oxoglutarate ferredoxin oxidoreductase subunit beta
MTTKTAPSGLYKNNYCPGCGHGIAARLLHELFEELGYKKNCCIIAGVGCCCNMTHIGPHDSFQCAHGRAAATATGMKRVRPDMLCTVYQGDGDGGVIGLAETLNAAYRNENISVLLINNTNFGMTGGQMSWTTLPGEITTTTVNGRDCTLSGEPLHLPEMIANNFNVAYVARGSVNNVKNIVHTKQLMKNALEAQINNEGYAFVEILSQCPTNWHLSPLKSLERVQNELIPVYPLGVFKERRTDR